MSRPFDAKAFLEFCRSRPVDESYCLCADRCALAQFGCPGVTDGNAAPGTPLADALEVALTGVMTFGALTARLEALTS